MSWEVLLDDEKMKNLPKWLDRKHKLKNDFSIIFLIKKNTDSISNKFFN